MQCHIVVCEHEARLSDALRAFTQDAFVHSNTDGRNETEHRARDVLLKHNPVSNRLFAPNLQTVYLLSLLMPLQCSAIFFLPGNTKGKLHFDLMKSVWWYLKV